MKKSIIGLCLITASLFALTGEEVYTQNCASCHSMEMMMDQSKMKQMREKMQNATQEEKQSMRQKMMQKMENSNMKAPAMPMVSMRLKKMTDSKEHFITFVKDYIQNPSQDKGYCMPMAYKRFGTMPPIGKAMSETERDLVANWLYDSFKGSWDNSMGGQTCNQKNRKAKMKCGAGKCGTK